MGFEDAVRAKHEFLDAYHDLLACLAVMTSREIEIAAARIADRLPNIKIDEQRQSSLVCGQVMRIVLSLRERGDLAESRLKRIWYTTTRKGELKRKIARGVREVDLETFQKEASRVKKKRTELEREHADEMRNWKGKVAKLNRWARWFNKPPKPRMPTYPNFPARPLELSNYEWKFTSHLDTSELLILSVVHHDFPHLHLATEFVNDTTVRETSIRLLEAK